MWGGSQLASWVLAETAGAEDQSSTIEAEVGIKGVFEGHFFFLRQGARHQAQSWTIWDPQGTG